jgi:hypothetical protein
LKTHAITGSIEAVGRLLGSLLDRDDLKVIGQGAILLLALALVAIVLAATAGLALAVFEGVRGL